MEIRQGKTRTIDYLHRFTNILFLYQFFADLNRVIEFNNKTIIFVRLIN